MNEELSRLMFDSLGRRVGSEVVCKVWESGEAKTYQGVLVEVVPFDFVNINKQLISFVGRNQAIEEILLADESQKQIYLNPTVAGYRGGFTDKDLMAVINAQEEYLGHSVLLDELQGNSSIKKK